MSPKRSRAAAPAAVAVMPTGRPRRVGAARIEDVVLASGGESVEAYVVGAAEGAPRAGVLFLHWLGEHRSDRTQFLPEAIGLAGLGVRSILPAGRFPWLVQPAGAESDVANIEIEVRREALALEALRSGLPRGAKLALVGHDFGAMAGILLAARHDLFRAAAIVAATPRWADWFLRFWPAVGDRFDYLRTLAPLDPVTAIAVVRARLLFQFSQSDYYMAPMSAVELSRSASAPATVEWYAADHAMRSRAARAAREAFLRRELGLD